jgi:predicted nucleic acid-binding protein
MRALDRGESFLVTRNGAAVGELRPVRQRTFVSATRAYGRVYAAVVTSRRRARGRRAVDLLLAATAVSLGLPLFTRNQGDFEG